MKKKNSANGTNTIVSSSLPCFCGKDGKIITLYHYGHRNGIYVGAYTSKGIRCEEHERVEVRPR
jgi:hypothetical protein